MEDTERPAKRHKTGYGPVAAILVTVGAFFAAQGAAIVLVSLLPLITGWSVEKLQTWLTESTFAQFLTVLIMEAMTLWLLWVFLNIRKVSLRSIGLVGPRTRDVGYALAGIAVYLVSYVLIASLMSEIFPGLDTEQEQQLGFSKDIVGISLLFAFISLVVLPPITEEIVMRGFLYTGLRKKLPKIVAAVITSILFAAAHLQWGSGAALLWIAALDTFVLSMVLVYLREKTGSLWSPVLVHAIKNATAFFLLFIIKVA